MPWDITATNRYLATVETDIARGVWHDPRHGDLTFAEWVQRYLSVAGHKAATTRSRDETVLRVHLVPAFGPQRLAAIAPLDVQHIVNEMAARLCRRIILPRSGDTPRHVLEPAELHRLAAAMPREYCGKIVYVGGGLSLSHNGCVLN